jgi:hypothetical protein
MEEVGHITAANRRAVGRESKRRYPALIRRSFAEAATTPASKRAEVARFV